MKTKNTLAFLVSVVLILSVFLSCASNKAETPASPATSTPAAAATPAAPAKSDIKPMKLQLGHVNSPSPDDQYHTFATNFAKNIGDLSGGAIQVEILGSGQLGNERDMLEGMKLNTIDIAVISNVTFSAVNPQSNICELPFFFKDRETAAKFVDGDIMKEVTDAMQKPLGAVVLGWGEGGFRQIINNVRPITKPADLAGIKMKVPQAPMFIKTFQALGANPTPMATSEAFTALQQKTIDGMEVPIPSIYTSRYFEISKYMSMTGHMYNAISITIAKALWDTLTPDVQQMFKDAAVKAGQDERVFIKENDETQVKKMVEAGLIVNSDNIDIAAMKKAVEPVYTEYRNTIGAELFDRAVAAVK